MARIRTIKPEFWVDEKIICVTRSARLLLIGMLNFADDHGVLEDSPVQLKVRIFPGDAIAATEVQAWLNELVQVKLVLRWSTDGKDYLHIRNFNKHQAINRPTFSPFPLPPDFSEHSRSPHGALTEDSLRETETETETETEEKNIVPSKEGTRDIHPDVTPPDLMDEKKVKAAHQELIKGRKAKADFEIWWKAYPNRRKVGKPKCYEKWLQLRKDKKLLPLNEMLAVLERQKRSKDWLDAGGDFIPGPHPYLNQARYVDESLDSGQGLAPRPVFTPAPLQLTPENVHEYADPSCTICQGKGMFTKVLKGMAMRVQCECADIKFNAAKGESI